MEATTYRNPFARAELVPDTNDTGECAWCGCPTAPAYYHEPDDSPHHRQFMGHKCDIDCIAFFCGMGDEEKEAWQ